MTWRFPGNLPRAGDPIPEGSLVEGKLVNRVGVPSQVVKESDDRMAAARQALIKGNPTDQELGEIFRLISDDSEAVAEMTASSKRLRKLENDANASLDDIYRERQRNSQLRSKLSIRGLGRPQTNFATGFDNVVMQVDTNFRFNPEEALRPVKLCFADRFLFAARPSVPKRPVDPDAPPVDVGDNGELLSWEYRVTQLAAREWSVDEINVQDLFPIAEADGVFAAPSMVLFSQNDGVSRQFPPASHWGISRYSGRKPYFVLGSVGSARAESQILQVYETTQLTNENRTPASHYSSYEAGVTALAISSQSTLVAFAVRERAVHRVFVADLTRFDRSLTLVSEYFHKNPWLVNDSNQPGMRGLLRWPFQTTTSILLGMGSTMKTFGDLRPGPWRAKKMVQSKVKSNGNSTIRNDHF